MTTTPGVALAPTSPSPVTSFTTTDVDEAAAIGSHLYADHRLAPFDARAFAFETSTSSIGSVTVGESSFGGPVRFRLGGLNDLYWVVIPGLSTLELTVGSRAHTATPEAAAVAGPLGELRGAGWHAEGERSPIICFDRRTLEAELGRLLDKEITSRIEFSMLMDLRSGRGAQWAAFARSVITALHTPNSLVLNPMLATQISSTLMIGLLLAAEHPDREALDAPIRAAVPPLIKRATTYIEDHAHDPLTVSGIAAALGISTRALQRGFAEHLNTTPGQYLARVRMDRAHRDLVNGSPENTTVARIASSWGFFHAGRFASQYRTRYGATPSEALRGR